MAHGEAAAIDLGHIRWIGLKTIVIREYGRIIRIWGQTLVPPAVTAMRRPSAFPTGSMGLACPWAD